MIWPFCGGCCIPHIPTHKPRRFLFDMYDIGFRNTMQKQRWLAVPSTSSKLNNILFHGKKHFDLLKNLYSHQETAVRVYTIYAWLYQKISAQICNFYLYRMSYSFNFFRSELNFLTSLPNELPGDYNMLLFDYIPPSY